MVRSQWLVLVLLLNGCPSNPKQEVQPDRPVKSASPPFETHTIVEQLRALQPVERPPLPEERVTDAPALPQRRVQQDDDGSAGAKVAQIVRPRGKRPKPEDRSDGEESYSLSLGSLSVQIAVTQGNRKAWIAIVLVILGIVLFLAFAFRHVSQPLSSWVYGLVAVIALLHDVMIPAGFYVAMGYFHLDFQIDVLFVTAILTILGFSVHDTIVVFDRTRENLKLRTWKDFDVTVGHSVEQTFVRSVNTSFTVLLVILALYFVGGETTKNFALTLAVGIIAGTYSSIFLASPLLVAIEDWQRKKEVANIQKNKKK